MEKIYIVAGGRTPFGRYRGFFKDQTAVDLGTMALKGVLDKYGLSPKQLDAVFLGNVYAAGQGQNPARQVALKSGLAQTSTAVTINEVCGSSLKAVRLAEAQMRLGDFGLVAVGGIESMTNTPFVLAKKYKDEPTGHLVNALMRDGLEDAFSGQAMGLTAENVAKRYHVSRAEMDEFAYQSHMKAAKAVEAGWFEDEILPSQLNGQTLTHDETIRPDTTVAKLAELDPVFKADGLVTAGTSSPVSDGASMIILATASKVQELGLTPLAELGAYSEVGFDPEYMGYTPYFAIKDLLEKTGTSLADYDVVELNEAFAAQAIAVSRDLQIAKEQLNPAGGALALGHPLGATGTRLVFAAVNSLRQMNGKQAIASLCIGGGLAIAYEIKRV